MKKGKRLPLSGLRFLKRRAMASKPGPPVKKDQTPEHTAYVWRRTIFCQVFHEGLKSALEQCAKEIACYVYQGEPGSLDIVAIPAFVIIVDRARVGVEEWKTYVEYSDEAWDDVPCLIVDTMKNLPLPKTAYHAFFDLSKRNSISLIIKTVKQLKRQMDKTLPRVFKKKVYYKDN